MRAYAQLKDVFGAESSEDSSRKRLPVTRKTDPVRQEAEEQAPQAQAMIRAGVRAEVQAASHRRL